MPLRCPTQNPEMDFDRGRASQPARSSEYLFSFPFPTPSSSSTPLNPPDPPPQAGATTNRTIHPPTFPVPHIASVTISFRSVGLHPAKEELRDLNKKKPAPLLLLDSARAKHLEQ